MYIDPFVAGILATLMVELSLIVIVSMWITRKKM